MFGLLGLYGTYEFRKVKHDRLDGWEVDTALVTDRAWTYETAVKHDSFNCGEWIIVAGTNTKEDSINAHNAWLKILESDVDVIEDIYEQVLYVKELSDD